MQYLVQGSLGLCITVPMDTPAKFVLNACDGIRINKTEIKFQGQSFKFLRNYKFYLGRKFYKNNQICATKKETK